MTDYDLSGFSSRSFEQLIQALALKVIGPSVVVYGDGPDGGREATFEGRVPYPSDNHQWEGYGVIQAKFLQRSRNSTRDGQWAVAQLKAELEKYLDPDNNLRKPDYFVFATNVVLTPVRGRGSKDKVEAVFEEFQDRLPLRGYAIWDYDQIRAFLDNYEEIRRGHAAWITPGDVLSEVLNWLQVKTPDLEETLTSFLQKELLSDEFVNLEQAGHDANERIPLARVFVDLHTRDEHRGTVQELEAHSPYQGGPPVGEDRGFIKEILEISLERLNRQFHTVHTIGQGPESEERQLSRGRFVLIGGPGQGKTTVGQFICQIFRAAIVSRRPQSTLSPETINALSIIRTHCKDEGIERLPVPRFPFRIVLNEFASALSATSGLGINSVFSYLAYQVSKRTDREISADDIRQWIGQYPSVIVFDGLDEVPSSSNRQQVLASIREFWVDANHHGADILAIATSRPQGYNEDFSSSYYQHRWLVPLSKELGSHFAKRLVDVRYGTDSDRKEKVLSRLERSFESESTSRLMRTPLQVTIMTALVDRMGQPPQARWNLFKSYYDVIYQREVERDIPASDLLRYYEPDINAIHSRVGLLLQIDSEQSGLTDAKFSAERFKSLVEKRLKEEGHEGEHLRVLTAQIFEAALERLVFLVGLESDQVGFEIRSLQEFMAAESLMEGSDEEIGRRLKEIAPIPNWRNVFLFASGKCFADRQHLRGTILSVCADLNETSGDEIASTYLVGSGLAIDLIEDGLSRHQPRFVQSFARIAMRSLDVPNPRSHAQLSSVYEPQLEQVFSEEISRRLNDNREYVRLGAWHCLVRLVDAQVPWAQDLAEMNWPSDLDEQLNILNQRTPFVRSQWVTTKFLQIAPQIPVSRIPELYRVGPIETQGAHPDQQAFIKVLQMPRHESDVQISFLQARLSLPALQLSERESSWLDGIQNLNNCHPSWTAYQVAAAFLQEPSKEKLSSVLKAIAPLIGNGIEPTAFRWRSAIPWPVLACLEMCTDETQLVDLANRASAGQLGDSSDWLAAENRWMERGITVEDLRSMTDDRLPFDDSIGTSGFPVTLSVWPMAIYGDEGKMLANLASVHSQLPNGKSRLFLARMFEVCLFHASLVVRGNEQVAPGTVDVNSLLSIYEDLGPGHVLPLSMIIGQIMGSSKEIAGFFAAMAEHRNQFSPYLYRQPLNQEQVERFRQAYRDVSDNTVLLPVIGCLAEHGYLAGHCLDIPCPEDLENPGLKTSAFVALLATESWETDNTERLLELLREIGLSSEDVYDRAITTVRENMPTGSFLNNFLLGLERTLPNNDYETRMSYVYLLEDYLRRRVSQFSDPKQFREFNLPQGVIELLSS